MEGFLQAVRMVQWYEPLAVFGGGFILGLVAFPRVPNALAMLLLGLLGFPLGVASFAADAWPGAIWAYAAFSGVTVGAALTKVMRNYAVERNHREAVAGALRRVR